MLSPVKTEPLYEKVEHQLLAYIASEKPKVLPGEKDLIKLFTVSRNTIRHAVQNLTRAGVLKPLRGRGTLVMKYSIDKPKDIGVICTDSIDTNSPWIASIMSTLKHRAHAKGYHLNLFFCHDYSIDELNDSAYSFLINSNRLAGLVLLSALKGEEIEHLIKIGLPFVTFDLRYTHFKHAAVLIDYIGTISQVIDHYISLGKTRFGITAQSCDFYEIGTQGINELIIEHWNELIAEKKLPLVKYDFNLNTAEQIKLFSALPDSKRPEVIISPYTIYAPIVDETLAKISDFNPIHIKSVMIGYETGNPEIVLDTTPAVQKTFDVLHNMIVNDCKLKKEEKLTVFVPQKTALARITV